MDNNGLYTAIGGIILAFTIGLTISSILVEKEAVKTQCAEYNSTTGKFQWIQPNKLEDDNRT